MLKENKAAFINNQLDKIDYMKRMHDTHKILYEYADYINQSRVLEIAIKNGEVYFTVLCNGLEIKMVSIRHDVVSVPFNFLDFDSHDLEETIFLLDVVKAQDVVLDIGANLGWYTLNWLQKNKKTTVFSFEPIQVIYDTLVTNLALNGQPTKNAFNYGLANANQELNFFFDTERCSASSMVNLRGSNDTIDVKCIVKKLDDIFPALNIGRLDFIKCDVEGAEKFVFDGGLETIKKYKPIIYSEMLRKWSKKFDYHPDDIIKLLAAAGYDCYIMAGNSLEKIDGVTEDTVETNFVFLDKTKNSHNDLLSRYHEN